MILTLDPTVPKTATVIHSYIKQSSLSSKRLESLKIFRLRKIGAEGEAKCSKAMALIIFFCRK